MSRGAAWLAMAALALLGCGERTTELLGGARAAVARDAGIDAAAMPPRDAGTPQRDAGRVSLDSGPRTPVLCEGNQPCACDNGVDDDMDGLPDGFDPECTGPADDDEASFATGTSDDERGGCRDCFFDANSGFGDDGCAYPESCFEGMLPTGDLSPSCMSCEVSQRCIDTCLPSTPNGCDCFGCCEVLRDDGSRIHIQLEAECSVEDIDDAQKCPRCVPSAECYNPCGVCELCPGRTAADLPELCQGQSTVPGLDYDCEGSGTPCSDAIPCPDQYYCQQGCCLQQLQ